MSIAAIITYSFSATAAPFNLEEQEQRIRSFAQKAFEIVTPYDVENFTYDNTRQLSILDDYFFAQQLYQDILSWTPQQRQAISKVIIEDILKYIQTPLDKDQEEALLQHLQKLLNKNLGMEEIYQESLKSIPIPSDTLKNADLKHLESIDYTVIELLDLKATVKTTDSNYFEKIDAAIIAMLNLKAALKTADSNYLKKIDAVVTAMSHLKTILTTADPTIREKGYEEDINELLIGILNFKTILIPFHALKNADSKHLEEADAAIITMFEEWLLETNKEIQEIQNIFDNMNKKHLNF